MKKMIMMAAMCMASSFAFAGDSPALKEILKAKTYEEAAALVKTNLSQLADNAEKAKAYNHLVDLAMKTVDKESTVITENQLQVQMGGKEKPLDTLAFCNGIVQSIDAALECNKYDQLPNAKGQVKPKFEKNAQRTWVNRYPILITYGDSKNQGGKPELALKFWGAYVKSYGDPFYAAQDKTKDAEYVGQIAYLAGRLAFEQKQYDLADEYLEIAKKDDKWKKDAFNYQLYAKKSNLNTPADTVKFIGDLKKFYEAEPENDAVLENLIAMYEGPDKKDQLTKLLDDHLAKYPNSYPALANKGLMAVNANQAEEGAKWLRKATDVKPDNAVVWTLLGACLSVQGANATDANQSKQFYQDAIAAFDKAKELDPRNTANWGYNRYQAYYALYGADDPKTQQAEADSK